MQGESLFSNLALAFNYKPIPYEGTNIVGKGGKLSENGRLAEVASTSHCFLSTRRIKGSTFCKSPRSKEEVDMEGKIAPILGLQYLQSHEVDAITSGSL